MKVLVVGATDPTGGAGLSRDVAALASLRIQALPVASGVTVQGRRGLSQVHPVPPGALRAQAESALEEGAAWMKAGALFSARQVVELEALVKRYDLRLVLDPVLGPTSGGAFLDDEAWRAMRLHLLPRAFLVTPNRREAQALTGEGEAERAAAALVGSGARASLVKGSGEAPDLLFDGRAAHSFPARFLPGLHRGTGCRLASLTTGRLALGMGLVESVRESHAQLHEELAYDAAEQAMDGPRFAHWRELESWMPRILAHIRPQDVPEVGINVAYALPGTREPADVLGLAGRITIAGTGRAVAGRLAFGGPHHTGRIAVVLQELDASVRIVMNHRFDEAYLEAARRGGLRDAGFRREDEPPGTPSTMEWGLREAARKLGFVPDLVWDRGGVGKEPMIRVLGRDPADLVRKLAILHG
jgi:hydroxymethylpyrimidine kinase / phosphomethylpyrimidine kinase / thiamine-phosphate diphosphorylase